jgi:hypothetical protein
MLSSLNACLIIARVSVTIFPTSAQNLMLFLCRIHCKIASGQIRYSKYKDVKNQHFHPTAWRFVHWLPRYGNTITYSRIVLLQNSEQIAAPVPEITDTSS